MQKHTQAGQMRQQQQQQQQRAPVRRWNSFHGGAGNYVVQSSLPGLVYQEAYLGSRAPRLPRAVQALRSESVDRSHPPRVQPPPPPAFPRRRFSVCFGKRTGGSARRPNECFVLEPSEMIAIDYPEVHSGRMHRPPQPNPDQRPSTGQPGV
ncbi:uncharacterized protein LOC131671909 isoform X1 [Phymastichus coffea]|uniref:uncharacterized protein LOC131671909 isoform X1 n=1 Tax=Phymastichus coffea TaxID=108790 RepID=UPI00273BD0F6|nr:uncharacterized protein LOC131671909 isoform X1 [Phymastichus coffea]XP_058804684.1 uncharacterized protein LOC131671909 isoform X1 [Phymastichus coffea]